MNGVPAINYQSSSGSWFGIPRSTWPGVLNAAYVNGSSNPLIPQQFQLLESLLQRANGSDADELTDFVVQCNVDQVTAWENLGLYTNGGQAPTTSGNYTTQDQHVAHVIQVTPVLTVSAKNASRLWPVMN